MKINNEKLNTNHGWWISAVLFVLAVTFMFNMWGEKKVIRDNPPVEKKFYSTDLARSPYARPEMKQGDFDYLCNDCHEMMEPPQRPPKLVADHEEIVLEHEPAMTCYTCHNRKDRNSLNDIYGNKVSFQESQELCHRCHGPRYRDWKLGIHGRVTGYWDKSKGESKNSGCVFCHNPHSPQFKPMTSSPSPVRDNFYIEGKQEVKEHKEGHHHE